MTPTRPFARCLLIVGFDLTNTISHGSKATLFSPTSTNDQTPMSNLSRSAHSPTIFTTESSTRCSPKASNGRRSLELIPQSIRRNISIAAGRRRAWRRGLPCLKQHLLHSPPLPRKLHPLADEGRQRRCHKQGSSRGVVTLAIPYVEVITPITQYTH